MVYILDFGPECLPIRIDKLGDIQITCTDSYAVRIRWGYIFHHESQLVDLTLPCAIWVSGQIANRAKLVVVFVCEVNLLSICSDFFLFGADGLTIGLHFDVQILWLALLNLSGLNLYQNVGLDRLGLIGVYHESKEIR